MMRCFDLATKGLGYAAPNPVVGCVIVNNNIIIGEGWHQAFGKEHAEVNAINCISDKNLLKFSTLYVNLEPCAHFGKTPPCTDLIIENKIPHVVIGCKDSFAEVNGRGIEKLKAAGIKVETGILEKESRELNKRFFIYQEKKRPYIILKWAQTADGFIASENHNETTRWISNEQSRMLVHKWRGEETAIMVGANTVSRDNPGLNVRYFAGKNPLRIIIDKNLDSPSNSKVYTDGGATVVLNTIKTETYQNVLFKKIDLNLDAVQNILSALYAMQVQSVLVEGGRMLLQSFIENKLWDEARVFVSDKVKFIAGTAAPIIKGRKLSEEKILNDTLYYYKPFI